MSGQIGSLKKLAAFMKKRDVFFTEDGHPFVLRAGMPGVEYRSGSVIRFRAVEPCTVVAWLNRRDLDQASRKTSLTEAMELAAAAVGVATVVVAGARAVDAAVNPPKSKSRLRDFYPWNW